MGRTRVKPPEKRPVGPWGRVICVALVKDADSDNEAPTGLVGGWPHSAVAKYETWL